MLNKLIFFFKNKENPKGKTGSINNSAIYIVDKKKELGGNIEILNKEDALVKGVYIDNKPPVNVEYYIFAENSFKKEIYKNHKLIGFERGDSYRHCECVLFPNDITNNPNCWILLIETKYAKDYAAASNKKNNYPQSMIEQIIQTTDYLRRHEIIPNNKRVHALVSFPNLIIKGYDSTLFLGNIFQDWNNKMLDIAKITLAYNVVIRPQNFCTINSETRLKFSK